MIGEFYFTNPFKEFRLSRGWSIEELEAKFSDVNKRRPLSRSVITDLEEYRYTIITVKIHNAYLSIFPEYDGTQVMRQYNEQKTVIRQSRCISLKNVTFANWTSGHPLYHYIKSLGHTIDSFADLLLIRKDNLEVIADPNLPEIIKEALAKCGMPQEDINTLSRMTYLHYMGELPHKKRDSLGA